jgi:predicted P-loop ATPase
VTAEPGSEHTTQSDETAIDRAERLLAELITAKAADDIHSDAFVDAIARAGSIKQAEAKRRLQCAFPELVFAAEWSLRIKAARIAIDSEKMTCRARVGWERDLILKPTKDGYGNPAACESNAVLIMRNHPDWQGKLGFNDFTGEHAILGDLPAPVSVRKGEPLKDHHDTLVQVWLQKNTLDPKWPIDAVRRSFDCVAKENSFNPVLDYLTKELPKWDGKERLPTWLETYCGAGPAEGADDRDSLRLARFISAIGERWWISLIARAFIPGCKVDHVLVLEGEKGIGKTTLVGKIFGEYYAFINGDVTSKDNQALLSAGAWGVLMDELDVLGKSAMRAVKQWVTQDHQQFRPVWGHRHEKRPRRCVFIATVNGSDWATEADRRWWPVHCKAGSFDLTGLGSDRDMLMAEGLFKFRAGKRWHFDDKEDAELISIAKEQQSIRVSLDVWHEKTMEAAEQLMSLGRKGVSVADIMEKMGIETPYQTNSDANRVGRSMHHAGWERRQVHLGVNAETGRPDKPWKYFPPLKLPTPPV